VGSDLTVRKPVVILIAEDELLVRLSAADILQEAGHHIIAARDGVEALAVLNVRDDVSALFTDIQMPSINGLALSQVVSERWPHIGIVVTSAALPLGTTLPLPPGARFVQKPYEAKVVLREIAAVLPVPSAIAQLRGTHPPVY
jgi:CheY-like chemotaxis protein